MSFRASAWAAIALSASPLRRRSAPRALRRAASRRGLNAGSRRLPSQALLPEFLGPLPCDQSAARENVPPACDGAPEDPHGTSNLAGQVLPARERDNANPTGGGEEREEAEEGEGDELAEADGGKEAEDSEHKAKECGGPLAQPHTVRRRLERPARGCEDAFWRHVRGVLHHLIHS
jgi:hypothetical protein